MCAFKCDSTLQLHILFDSENYCARGTPPTPIAINFTLICTRHTRSTASAAQRQVLAIAVASQLMLLCLCWPLSAKRPHARLRKLLTLQIAICASVCVVKQQATTHFSKGSAPCERMSLIRPVVRDGSRFCCTCTTYFKMHYLRAKFAYFMYVRLAVLKMAAVNCAYERCLRSRLYASNHSKKTSVFAVGASVLNSTSGNGNGCMLLQTARLAFFRHMMVCMCAS